MLNRTPLHTDVFSSFSWSANIVGKKKWFFIAPEESEKLKQFYKEKIPKRVSVISKEAGIHIIEVIQNEGEIIFVPSGWMHEVINLEDTISINHNWFNACNLNIVWNDLRKALRETEHELDDIRSLIDPLEFQHECQKVLKANYGMDYTQFVDILEKVITRIVSTSVSSGSKFYDYHEMFVITSLLKESSFLHEMRLVSGLESRVNTLHSTLTYFSQSKTKDGYTNNNFIK
ncbi:jmjC domain-containing protein 4-like protein [Dinothrombium tinctorium]|uniref:Jumonji domain-containing protein 4 n=1 Tax=Dinothrombium tinctorium TaxID=1965070 RepID=A0A443R764_9ACAR|nr:jmjC domain-containing protein 4-like protein [Dinothrombium tinctorium]